MFRKKVIFLGSKPIGYDCLLHLLSKQDVLNIEIVGLLTHSRREFGNTHDLYSLASEFNIHTLNNMEEMPECDIIYSVQHHEILKEKDIAKAKQIAVNLHMAPLPEYRGSNQFSYAIIDDKTEFGTTIHQIDTRVDHGGIMFQKRFPIPAKCWVNELYELTYKASLSLFTETIHDIINGNYTITPQHTFIDKYGTSLHLRNEIAHLKQIDLNWDKEKIEQHIRATFMPGFEPPYCMVNGKKLYFTAQY